jgi:hypothetical protein
MHEDDDVGHVLIRVNIFLEQLKLHFRDGLHYLRLLEKLRSSMTAIP